jgi:peroxiredoxin
MAGKAVDVGEVAPDFTIKDNHGKDVNLGRQRGKKVVLGFHPLAWTAVCAQQMKDLEANSDRFAKAGAIAYGLSVDSTFCKKAWAEHLGIEKTQLLSDFWPHGAVAAAYGVFRDAHGTSERAVFIVDEKGTVRFRKIYPIAEVPDIEEIVAAVGRM